MALNAVAADLAELALPTAATSASTAPLASSDSRIGVAERALETMCRRVGARVAFGKTLAEQGTIRRAIAESRIDIDQARLLTLRAAHLMETVGNKAARAEIAMIKVVAPNAALRVLDRAIQAHGAAGVSRRCAKPSRDRSEKSSPL